MNQIITSIIDYIKNDNAYYSVMINGEWGSGKTYFFNNVLKKEIEELNKNICVIYITLNGTKTVEEVKIQILLSLIANLKSENFFNKAINKISKKSEVSLSDFTKIISNSNNLIYLSNLVYNLIANSINNGNKIVLCFDDLERSEIKIGNVLGFINHFVEHDRAKVIIICHEPSINNNDEYKKIKEKVIGKTFQYNANNDEIIEEIIKGYKTNEKYYRFLSSNKELIKKLYELSFTNNIRSLKIAINEFELIFIKTLEYNINLTYLKLMLRLTMALIFEIKKDNLNLDAIMEDKFIYLQDNNDDSDINIFVKKY